VARAIAGFAGGNISVAQAYIADVTLPSQRSRGMGLVGAAFGLGFIVGPALGAFAAHYGGLRAVGFVGAGLCVVNLVSAFLVLQESLRHEHRAARPLVNMTHLRRGLTDPRFQHLFVVFGLIPFAFSGYVVAVPLFAEGEFGWGSAQLGTLFTVIGVIAASVQGYLFGKIQRRTGDRPLIAWGTLGMAIGIAAIPLVGRSWEMFPCVVILAFGNSIAAPALTGLISTLTGPAEQGAMMGAAQALTAIGRFSGPFLFGQLYDVAGPPATFAAAAGTMLLAWLVTLRIRPAEPETAPTEGREHGRT
jgi:predicted MFS family arabinose efflux permease